MLCDAFCSHTAVPRAKGMHQPRDSAVFFSKQTATAAARNQYTSIQRDSGRAQTVKGGEGGGQQFTFCQADVDQNETEHAKAQEARNRAWEAQFSPLQGKGGAKKDKPEAKKAEKAAKAKAEKKAGKYAQKKAADDAKAPVSNRGRGIARDRGVASTTDGSKTTENETDTDSTEASGDGAETPTRGKGANPLLEQFKREFCKTALKLLGKRCGRSLCHDQCNLSSSAGEAKSPAAANVVCNFEHPPEPFTSAEVAALPVETRIWPIVYGGFRGQTKVPYAMRRGAIVKALTELSRDSLGKGMRLPARFYEQYGEVKADDHDMQLPLADLVADNATSVFEQRPEAPRHHEPAASVTDQVAASREGLTIGQRSIVRRWSQARFSRR